MSEGDETASALKKAGYNLSEIWGLSAEQRDRLMGFDGPEEIWKEKVALCIQIHTSLSAKYPDEPEQVCAWLNDVQEGSSSLVNQIPLAVMEQSTPGLRRVLSHLTCR